MLHTTAIIMASLGSTLASTPSPSSFMAISNDGGLIITVEGTKHKKGSYVWNHFTNVELHMRELLLRQRPLYNLNELLKIL